MYSDLSQGSNQYNLSPIASKSKLPLWIVELMIVIFLDIPATVTLTSFEIPPVTMTVPVRFTAMICSGESPLTMSS
jgi:hypothetical protein